MNVLSDISDNPVDRDFLFSTVYKYLEQELWAAWQKLVTIPLIGIFCFLLDDVIGTAKERGIDVTIPLIGIFCFLPSSTDRRRRTRLTSVTIPLIGIFCFLPSTIAHGGERTYYCDNPVDRDFLFSTIN